VLAGAAASSAPLRIECGTIDQRTCRETVTAALDRALPSLHPLVLAARVGPGPAWPNGMGHRATVTFDLAGVPGSTDVRLFYDMGGHWGGTTDRGAIELAAWALAWAGIMATLVTSAGTRVVSRVRPPVRPG
jgi:hypothetical protein